MKLLDKTLELENNNFKIIKFDNERYEKNNRAHLYYIIQCKKCDKTFSRKKDCIHNFENLVLATFSFEPSPCSLASAYGGLIRTNIFLPSAIAFRRLSGTLLVRV